MLDRIQANTSTDAPFSAAEIARFLNDAYSDVYEISESSHKTVASATAWTSAETATGYVVGLLTDMRDVLHCWASTTSGSVGRSSGDVELDRVELSRVLALRQSSMTGTYALPKVYAISRVATVTPASVGLHRLDYWPSVTGFYFPIMYLPQLTEIDSATVTTPDVNDIESRDIGLLAAARAAPLVGRHDLVPSILADVSERTARALERKMKTLLHAGQDTR